MKATLLQTAPVWEDRRANRERVAALVAGLETDWIVLPEMALSGFTMDRGASTWDRDDLAFFAALARDRACFITVGAVLDGRNTALAFGPQGDIVATYEKRHLFSFSGEDRHYEAGSRRSAYRVGDLRVAQAICYDLRFPYHFWPEAPEVEAYCVIAAWGGKRAEHWKTLLRARAVENQAFVIGVNRTGKEPGVEYSGDSALIDPQGRALLDCGSAEGAYSVEFDPAEAGAWRRTFPAQKDRRE